MRITITSFSSLKPIKTGRKKGKKMKVERIQEQTYTGQYNHTHRHIQYQQRDLSLYSS